MSTGRVVAIYHKETRKVLGHIPCDVITKQTKGRYHKFAIVYRSSAPMGFFNSEPGADFVQINYGVVHSDKGMPISVIADSQEDANWLIRTEGLTWEERAAALFNEPNPLLEGLELR